MKRHILCLGLGLLVLVLAACSIPVLAYSVNGATVTGDTDGFSWEYNESLLYLDIVPIGSSVQLNKNIVDNILYQIKEARNNAASVAGTIQTLQLSKQITLAQNTFTDFTGLRHLYYLNENGTVGSAFPSSLKIHSITTGNGITGITTRWGIPDDTVYFAYSAVRNDTSATIFDVSSNPPINITLDKDSLPYFVMKESAVSLSIHNASADSTSGGVEVSFLVCQVTISAAPGITYKVNNLGPYDYYSGEQSFTLSGSDDTFFVNVIQKPSDGFTPLLTNISNVTMSADGNSFTITGFTDDANRGHASIYLNSSIPKPDPTPVPTTSPTTSPTRRPSGPTEDQQTKINPWNPFDSGGSSEAAIDGIVTSTGDNRATIEDVTTVYPGVSEAANTAISCTAAVVAVTSGSTDLLTASAGLSAETSARVDEILTNAVAKGILSPSTTTLPLIISISGAKPGEVTPVQFYKTFDITPYSGEDSLREVNFAVPLADINAAGVTESDVILYHGYPDDNIWVPLETALTSSDGTTCHYTAKTNGASPFAILFARQNIVIEPGQPIDKVFVNSWTSTIRVIVAISIILAVLAVGAVIVFTVVKYSKNRQYPIYRKYRKASRQLFRKYRR